MPVYGEAVPKCKVFLGVQGMQKPVGSQWPASDMRWMLACESDHGDRAIIMRPAKSAKATLACDRGSRGSVERLCFGKPSGCMNFLNYQKWPRPRFLGRCRHDSTAGLKRDDDDNLALGTPRRTGPIASLDDGGRM